MRPSLRPFRPGDLVALVNRDGQQIPHEIIERQAAAGVAFTATVQEIPIGCAGLIVIWPGVAVTWMILGPDAAKYGIWLTRTVRTFLGVMRQLHNLHRIEAFSLQASSCNQRWLEVFGFTKERDGVARGYLPDKSNFIRYELLKGVD